MQAEVTIGENKPLGMKKFPFAIFFSSNGHRRRNSGQFGSAAKDFVRESQELILLYNLFTVSLYFNLPTGTHPAEHRCGNIVMTGIPAERLCH